MTKFVLSPLIAAALLAPAALGTAAASTGPAAHAADSHRHAVRECREERREHPRAYRHRYGTGKQAMQRCVRHERRDHERNDGD